MGFKSKTKPKPAVDPPSTKKVRKRKPEKTKAKAAVPKVEPKPVTSKANKADADDFGMTVSAMKGYLQLSSQLKNWSPPDSVLQEVEAQQTRFPWFDWASRCGGLPIRRVLFLHGPAGCGKTSFGMGLGESFLQNNHFFAYADAERTTPPSFAREMLKRMYGHPCFVAMKPRSFEHMVDSTKEFCDRIVEARQKGLIPEQTTGLIFLDSLTKLIPMDQLEKMLKQKAETAKGSIGGKDGGEGREIAKLNKLWFRRLTIDLDEARVGFVAIIREVQNMAQHSRRSWALPGGTDTIFESSLTVRVTNDFDTKNEKEYVRHKLQIYKSKVGRQIDPTEAFFCELPEGGFDQERDLVQLAIRLDVVEQKLGKKPTIQTFDGEILVEGKEQELVEKLRADRKLAVWLEGECRKRFDLVKP